MYRNIDEEYVRRNYGLIGGFIGYYNKKQNSPSNYINYDDWHGILSESYLRAIKSHDRSKSKLSTYFYRIAENSVNQEKTRLGVKSGPEIVDGYYIEGLLSGGSTSDDYEIGYKSLLSELGSLDLNIVELIMEGYTHEEIGEALGIARSTVSSRMRRLRIKLKEGEIWQYYTSTQF